MVRKRPFVAQGKRADAAATVGGEKGGRESDSTLRSSGLVYTRKNSRNYPACQLLYWYDSNELWKRVRTDPPQEPVERAFQIHFSCIREAATRQKRVRMTRNLKTPHVKTACDALG